MRNYEATFILDPKVTEEQQASVIEKLTNLVTSNSGEVVEVNNWGKRRLAYEIKNNREGSYVVFKFRSKKEQAIEIERILRIQDEVLKAILVRN